MKYLFTREGTQVIQALTFTKTLFAFDFDGTLVPIKQTPSEVSMSDGMADSLKALAFHTDVAIISGRSIKDLQSKIGFTPKYLIGNHGLEGLAIGKGTATQALQTCRAWHAQLKSRWGSLRRDPGVFVEDKTYSLALHYRGSRSKKNARMELFTRIEGLRPSPRVILGKCVMNLIPSGAPHKGVALLRLMMESGHRCAFYVGDDDTDEDVFSLPESRIITVRVGKKKSSHALYFVKHPGEVRKLLKILLGFYVKGKKR